MSAADFLARVDEARHTYRSRLRDEAAIQIMTALCTGIFEGGPALSELKRCRLAATAYDLAEALMVERDARLQVGPACRHESSVMGRRGSDDDGETVSVCRGCGEISSIRKERNPFTAVRPDEWLQPCSGCGLRFSDLNPWSGLCAVLHERRCGK